MQIPRRRAQINRIQDEESRSQELTPEALARLKRTLEQLEKVDRPKIVEDLTFALSLGDFSENAEYQDAKMRLGKIDGRIFSLQQRIKNAVLIEPSASGTIGIGSRVTIRMNNQQREYRILGSQESNPARGNISYLSPLGKALMGHKAGDQIEYKTPDGTISLVEIHEVL